jgi:hypothetical protein
MLGVALSAVVLASAAAAAEPSWGRLYILPVAVSVRENPSDTALQVRVLKAGQKVRVDFQEDGWAAVFDPKETKRSELKALGYAKLAELKAPGGASEQVTGSSIEVRKPAPDAKAEVLVNGRPVNAKADKGGKRAAKEPAREAKAPGKGFGEVRVADRQLTVRAARDKDSEFRKVLKPGQKVRVDFHEDGWFAVFDPEETVRDLKRAWGYGRDKYLVPEAAYSGPPAEAMAPGAAQAPAPDKGQKAKPGEEAVGYSVLQRKTDRHKPPVTTLRVRLDLAQPPTQEAMRKIAQEIWKAERKKDENLQLELYLSSMDPKGLAYAVAKFHEDGRVREFWWRDVVLDKTKK